MSRKQELVRVAPQNIEAEQDLLGSVMLDPSSSDHLTALPLEVFYDEKNRMVARAITAIVNRGEHPDMGLMRNELEAMGKLDEVGGLPYIIGLHDMVGTSAYADQHALAVLTAHRQREVIRIAGAAMRAAYERKDPTDLLTAHEAELTRLSASEAVDRGHSEYLEDALSFFRGEGGVETGFSDLDMFTGGLVRGGYNVIAGRPSMGKSSIMRSMIAHRIAKGDRVALFSIDQSGGDIVAITAAQRSGVRLTDFHRLKRSAGGIPVALYERAAAAARALRTEWEGKFALYDNVADLERIMQLARREIRNGASMIVLDHIGSVIVPGNKNETDMVTEVSRQFKALSREYNVTVLLLSQLNRGVEQRPDKRPTLADLRQSGAIEQDANQVLMLYREDYYAERSGEVSENPGVIEVGVMKQKMGGAGTIELTWLGDQIRAVNKARPAQLEAGNPSYVN